MPTPKNRSIEKSNDPSPNGDSPPLWNEGEVTEALLFLATAPLPGVLVGDGMYVTGGGVLGFESWVENVGGAASDGDVGETLAKELSKE